MQAPPVDDYEEYRGHLSAGRRHARAERFAEAIAAFREALAISPSDPAALGELGWAAFRRQDYDLAIESTTEALSLAYEPRRQAALLYNLGRIAEAHHGRLEVHSTPGLGSDFSLTLPIRHESEHGDQAGNA